MKNLSENSWEDSERRTRTPEERLLGLSEVSLCVANVPAPVDTSGVSQPVCQGQRAVQDWGVWDDAVFLLW